MSASSVQQKSSSSSSYALSSGLHLEFRDPKSSSTLQRWARELDSNGGTVTHAAAVFREQDVVRKVESGEWSPAAYNDYQRLAAGSGNVDSARLILEYGVKASLQLAGAKTPLGKLFRAVLACDGAEYVRLLALHEELSAASVSEDGTTVLIAAAFQGCIDIVEKVLRGADAGDVDVDATAANGATAVMTAAAQGHVDVMRLLVTTGKAQVNAKHKFAGNTALHMAAELSQDAAVTALCGLGADPKALTSTGSTALHVAAHTGASAATVAALLSVCVCGACHVPTADYSPPHIPHASLSLVQACHSDPEALMNGDTTAVYLAAQHGHTETLQALLAGGARHSHAMPASDYKGERFLARTGTGKDDEAAFFAGPPINTEPGNGAMPIHAAVENGHLNATLTLLDAGVDIDTPSMGVTPLILAAMYNRTTIVATLIARGAALEARSTPDGCTALYFASGHHFHEVARLLLAAGASPHTPHTRSGGLPLLYAVLTGDARIVSLLLAHGADPARAAGDGALPLHVAAAQGNVATATALLRARPGPQLLELTNPTGLTALHVAAQARATPVLYTLLRHAQAAAEADAAFSFAEWLDTRDEVDGAAALHLAAQTAPPTPPRGDGDGDGGGAGAGPSASDAVAVLLGFGADANVEMDGDAAACATPLHFAAQGGSAEAVGALLLAGARADPVLCAAEREAPLPTPLLMAVDRGHVEAVKMLLRPAAQVPKLLRVPYTPRAAAVDVDVGATGDVQKVAGAASGAGADPDKGAPGSGLAQSPLLLAVARGHSAVARALLDAGAACNILVATGRRPEDAQRPQTRMVRTSGSLPQRWYHHLLAHPRSPLWCRLRKRWWTWPGGGATSTCSRR